MDGREREKQSGMHSIETGRTGDVVAMTGERGAEVHMPSAPSQQDSEQHPGAYTGSDLAPRTCPPKAAGSPWPPLNNSEEPLD